MILSISGKTYILVIARTYEILLKTKQKQKPPDSVSFSQILILRQHIPCNNLIDFPTHIGTIKVDLSILYMCLKRSRVEIFYFHPFAFYTERNFQTATRHFLIYLNTYDTYMAKI